MKLLVTVATCLALLYFGGGVVLLAYETPAFLISVAAFGCLIAALWSLTSKRQGVPTWGLVLSIVTGGLYLAIREIEPGLVEAAITADWASYRP